MSLREKAIAIDEKYKVDNSSHRIQALNQKYLLTLSLWNNYNNVSLKQKQMETIGKILGAFILLYITLAIVGIIIGFPLMWLWNWLMPELFGLKTITFWQAVGLYLLAGLLIRGSTSTSKEQQNQTENLKGDQKPYVRLLFSTKNNLQNDEKRESMQ